jgi:hypothetical protein
MSSGTPEQRQAGMDAWMKWGNEAGGSLVDWGAPLGETRTVGDGVASSPGYVGGYSIVEADSFDAAVKLLGNHPHLMTPGGAAIEVHELLPMPGA